jgi:DNA-3-methyladenine glycosylase II
MTAVSRVKGGGGVVGPGEVTFRMRPRGPFSLAAAVRFQETFPAFAGAPGDFVLAFPAETSWSTVGVRVTDHQSASAPQDGTPDRVKIAGDLAGQVVANPGGLPEEEIRTQVERILSLDVDGSGFAAVGERDPVVGDLQRQFPGLRPVLFPSPYEAAAWALIGHRISMVQGATLRRRLSEELGDRVEIDGRPLATFPPPERLARLEPMPGMTLRKVANLRALGEAALAGELDTDLLRGMPVDEALTHLTKLPGIGPFSAELTLIRGAGLADMFPRETPRLHRAMAEAYDLGPEPPLARLEAIAGAWRPFRGWVAFLLRNAA